MKRLCLSLLILMIFCLTAPSIAEEIHINLNEASDNEIENAISLLQEERVVRIKDKLSNIAIEPKDGISFRGIPWYSSRANAERILGVVSNTGESNRLSRIDKIGKNVYTSATYIEGQVGSEASYPYLTVAGYAPSSAHICYLYPIVDGEIVRDLSLAQIYMGYYEFSKLGDASILYNDLKKKLDNLYGDGSSSTDDKTETCVWMDDDNNIVRLREQWGTYVSLAYMAADAETRLNEMASAISAERAEAEQMQAIENQENVDGL